MKKWITISLTLIAFGALAVALSRWWLPLLGLAGVGNERLRPVDELWPWLIWIFIGALALLLVNLRWDRLFQRHKARRLVDEAEEWSDEFRIGSDLPLELANQEPAPAPELPKSNVRLFAEQLEPVERQEALPIAAAPEQAPPVEEPAAPPAPLPKKYRERVTVAFADEPEAVVVALPASGELTLPLSTNEEAEKITPSDIANAAAIAQAEQLPASFFQLPPLPEAFTGRAAELAELHAALAHPAQRSLGIYGPGGTGKTALALTLAHQLAAHYPDAQFYLDLKGTSLRPLSTAEILAHVLRVYHPGARLSEDEAELQQAYQTALTGKRALLLFDNAADLIQVSQLAPPPGSLLMLTARQPFTLPGLFLQLLDQLAPADAENLLRRLVPRTGELAAEIARQCGYLPLALRLAATALAQRPELSAAGYSLKLAQVAQRLSTTGQPQSYEPVLTLSYELLSPGLQKLWRTLAVFPDTFDVTGAAAVWGLHPERALRALRRLMEFELVDSQAATGRYRLHDLKQTFANQLLRDAERRVCLQNHAEYYQSVLHEADALYEQGGISIKRGLGLVDRDWHNIEAGQTWAAINAETDQAACELCSSYPDAGRYVLDLRQSPQDRLRWCEAALAAAVRLNRRKAESRHLLTLGRTYLQLNELEQARNYYERALALAREQADHGGEARALNGLGAAQCAAKAFEKARTYHTQALEIARAHHDPRNEAQALGGLGLVQAAQGEHAAARAALEQALALTRATGDLAGQGLAHFQLAQALVLAGERAPALAQAQAALALLESLQSCLAETVRQQLGEWHAGTGPTHVL